MPKVNMPTAAPARKVVGASAGAGLGGVIATFVLWALDDTVFDPKVPDSVPGPVAALVLAVVPLAVAFLGGYFTRRNVDELIVPARNERGSVDTLLLIAVAALVIATLAIFGVRLG